MELTGERIIAADRATVWKALNDPEVLKSCIPGCESMEWTGENALTAEVAQKVGPVKARFKGAVTLEDVVEAQSYRIVGEGKGGAAGFAKGGAAVSLSDDEGGTKLSYEAEAKVGGKLAQLGSRLIDGFARKMADEFFDRFKSAVEAPAEGETTAEAANAPVAEPVAKDPAPVAKQHVPVATPSSATPEEMKGTPAPTAPPVKGHEAAFQAALPDGTFEGDDKIATPATSTPVETMGQAAPSAPAPDPETAAPTTPEAVSEAEATVATPSSATPPEMVGTPAPTAPPVKGQEAAFQAALPDGSFEGDEKVATPANATPAASMGQAAPSAPAPDPETAAPETPEEAGEVPVATATPAAEKASAPAAAVEEAAPEAAKPPEKKKSWFQRLFG